MTLKALQPWLVWFRGEQSAHMRATQEYTVILTVFESGSNQLRCAVISNVQMVVIASLISPNQKDFVFVSDHGLAKNAKTLIPVFVGMNTKKKLHLVSLHWNVKSFKAWMKRKRNVMNLEQVIVILLFIQMKDN